MGENIHMVNFTSALLTNRHKQKKKEEGGCTLKVREEEEKLQGRGSFLLMLIDPKRDYCSLM